MGVATHVSWDGEDGSHVLASMYLDETHLETPYQGGLKSWINDIWFEEGYFD